MRGERRLPTAGMKAWYRPESRPANWRAGKVVAARILAEGGIGLEASDSAMLRKGVVVEVVIAPEALARMVRALAREGGEAWARFGAELARGGDGDGG